jgi:hypothetical protein
MEKGDEQPEGAHVDPHKGFKGTSLLHRMLPSVF